MHDTHCQKPLLRNTMYINHYKNVGCLSPGNDTKVEIKREGGNCDHFPRRTSGRILFTLQSTYWFMLKACNKYELAFRKSWHQNHSTLAVILSFTKLRTCKLVWRHENSPSQCRNIAILQSLQKGNSTKGEICKNSTSIRRVESLEDPLQETLLSPRVWKF